MNTDASRTHLGDSFEGALQIPWWSRDLQRAVIFVRRSEIGMGMVVFLLTQQGQSFVDSMRAVTQLIAFPLRDESGVIVAWLPWVLESDCGIELAQAFPRRPSVSCGTRVRLWRTSRYLISAQILNVLATRFMKQNGAQWAAEITHYPRT